MSPEYQRALNSLTPINRQAVDAIFVEWAGDASLGQVNQNISTETALANADFQSLLTVFADLLRTAGSEPRSCWETACRRHKLKGPQIPPAQCPKVLGRVKTLEEHADAIAKASDGALTLPEAMGMLMKYKGALDVMDLETFLFEAPLGKYDLVWATFDAAHPDNSPFPSLPPTRLGIRCALGLGHLRDDDSLILLCWHHVESGSPPLHRPTVADAEAYEYYQPCPKASHPWGLTRPLPSNLDGISPQPEVVMREPTSRGLHLPFEVI